MNFREADRYDGRSMAGKAAAGIAVCRFDFNRDLTATLVDISLKGFGIEIAPVSGSQVDEIKNMGNYMITVDFGTETVMAVVKNAWNMVLFEKDKMIFRGGVAIEVMSPEDRIVLSNIIEKIRFGR